MIVQPWEQFASALTREMRREPPLSARELATLLVGKTDDTVSEDTVSNWRRGRSRPSLDMLRHIVDALNEDRVGNELFTLLTLLQEMGVLPPEATDEQLFDRAYRLQKLNLKLEDASNAVAELGRRAGASRIVQEATVSGNWAVAVWPALEGPDEATRLHVADRLDIRYIAPNIPANVNVDEVIWKDPGMKAALRSTNAVPSGEKSRPRWVGEPEPLVSRWSISHVGSPREPVVSGPWTGLRSICVIATTRGSWVQDVAALLAFALGYGLTTTGNLAMTMTGRAPGNTSEKDRYMQHQGLLEKPPFRRVWAHYGLPPAVDSVFGDVGLEPTKMTRFIYLDESDEQLRAEAADEPAFERFKGARNIFRTQIGTVPVSNLLRLATNRTNSRTESWALVFSQVEQSLKWLSGPEAGVRIEPRALREAHAASARRDPGVSIPLMRWLDARGWPAEKS